MMTGADIIIAHRKPYANAKIADENSDSPRADAVALQQDSEKAQHRFFVCAQHRQGLLGVSNHLLHPQKVVPSPEFRPDGGHMRHTVELGTDPIGNITRTENVIDGFGKKRDACREQLATVQSQLEAAKIEVQKPFAQENELTQKLARLAELNAHLNLDEKESVLVLLDGEPDEGEDKAVPEKSSGAK